MTKMIPIDAVHHAMLESLSKKARMRPEEYIKRLIKENYERLK
jgi:hypothetical protein